MGSQDPSPRADLCYLPGCAIAGMESEVDQDVTPSSPIQAWASQHCLSCCAKRLHMWQFSLRGTSHLFYVFQAKGPAQLNILQRHSLPILTGEELTHLENKVYFLIVLTLS